MEKKHKFLLNCLSVILIFIALFAVIQATFEDTDDDDIFGILPSSIIECGNDICEIGEPGSCFADCECYTMYICGDGLCGPQSGNNYYCENAASCPEDCPQYCGDGVCTGFETSSSCPGDCLSVCGDGFCCSDLDGFRKYLGMFSCAPEEGASTCPGDCAAFCGDGFCTHNETAVSCPSDCPADCGDGSCEGTETILTCPFDCSVCGDGSCTGTETIVNCSQDCKTTPEETGEGETPYCGDSTCNANEDAVTCPSDCTAVCGDGACTIRETPENCARDCLRGCGNGICEPDETQYSCPNDCGFAGEKIIFNQNISYEEITTKNPNEIRQALSNMGFDDSIETIDAGTKNFKLSRAIALQKYSIGHYTAPELRIMVTLAIENKTEKHYANLSIIELIPKQLASNASQIKSPNQYTVIQEDPILQFTINTLTSNEQKTISYTLPYNENIEQQLGSFSNPIVRNFRGVSEEELANIGCQSNNECPNKTCYLSRCIQKECYNLKQSPGVSCGPNQECNSNQECVEKTTIEYTQPTNLLNLPTIILIIAIILIAIWIIKEYAIE